jgi:hypothetical protein
LHKTDIQTGEVLLIETNGCSPSPRTTPIMTEYKDQLYIWGGFNGEWPNELHILNPITMTWSKYPQKITGRTDLPSVHLNSFLYALGGSKSDGLLTIDFNHQQLNLNEMRGTQLPAAFPGAGMVSYPSLFNSIWWSI